MSPHENVIRNAYLLPAERLQVSYFLSSGLHPWFVSRIKTDLALSVLRKNLQLAKVKALGEIGLDHAVPHISLQTEAFKKQLQLSDEFRKPVILHQVRAVELMAKCIKDHGQSRILHGFSQHPKVWEQLNKDGKTYVSFGAAVFKAGKKLQESIREIPLEYMLCETDNEKIPVKQVIEKLAQLRSIDFEVLRNHLHENARRVFDLP